MVKKDVAPFGDADIGITVSSPSLPRIVFCSHFSMQDLHGKKEKKTEDYLLCFMATFMVVMY